MKILFYTSKLKYVKESIVSEILTRALVEMHPQMYVNSDLHKILLKNHWDVQSVTKVESVVEVANIGIDMIIAVGGDGTILSAATEFIGLGLPIFGINLGRLGFLTSTDPINLWEAFSMLKSGDYTIENRSMLRVQSNIPIFTSNPYALNDFTVHKRDTSSMVKITVTINNAILNEYWSDGIIVATPTGSTGYSLSCGGPIVEPNTCTLVITPVAPHNLNTRPIVISDQSKLKIMIEGRSDHFLCTMDSRYEKIGKKHELYLEKAQYYTRLVRLNNINYYKVIRDKLMWGTDYRN